MVHDVVVAHEMSVIDDVSSSRKGTIPLIVTRTIDHDALLDVVRSRMAPAS
jgi:hypothetical protein